MNAPAYEPPMEKRAFFIPQQTIRKLGPFYYHVYVATHYFTNGVRGFPMNLFVGTARTRRGARKLAARELAGRRG